MRSKSYEYRKTNTSCNLERIEYRATEAKAKGNTPIRSNLLLSGYRSAACLYSSGCLHGRSTSAAGRPIEPAPCGQAKAQGPRRASSGGRQAAGVTGRAEELRATSDAQRGEGPTGGR
jgi:hypothetical protein